MKRTVISSAIAVSAALIALLLAVMFMNYAVAAPLSKANAAAMSRLTEAFAEFAGSPANAQSLVEGLHNGTAIRLVGIDNAQKTFSPATKSMSWDDVKIALALANAELGSADIFSPTPVDIEAVLDGGTAGTGDLMINFTGVLTQRASGLRWDQIARAHSLDIDMLVTGASKATPSAEHADITSMTLVSTVKKQQKKQSKRNP
jgi:hypothetical protein